MAQLAQLMLVPRALRSVGNPVATMVPSREDMNRAIETMAKSSQGPLVRGAGPVACGAGPASRGVAPLGCGVGLPAPWVQTAGLLARARPAFVTFVSLLALGGLSALITSLPPRAPGRGPNAGRPGAAGPEDQRRPPGAVFATGYLNDHLASNRFTRGGLPTVRRRAGSGRTSRGPQVASEGLAGQWWPAQRAMSPTGLTRPRSSSPLQLPGVRPCPSRHSRPPETRMFSSAVEVALALLPGNGCRRSLAHRPRFRRRPCDLLYKKLRSVFRISPHPAEKRAFSGIKPKSLALAGSPWLFFCAAGSPARPLAGAVLAGAGHGSFGGAVEERRTRWGGGSRTTMS